MTEIKVLVDIQGITHEVVFQGEKLGMSPMNMRRNWTETLYRTEDGRLIVHVHILPTTRDEQHGYGLHQVTESDLQAGGRYADLGAECGFASSMTLDEALAQQNSDF